MTDSKPQSRPPADIVREALRYVRYDERDGFTPQLVRESFDSLVEQHGELQDVADETAIRLGASRARVVELEEQLEAKDRAISQLEGSWRECSDHRERILEQYEGWVKLSHQLFNMIPREVWRDQGGDDGQGHYEGEYHAERIEQEIHAALASFPAKEPEDQDFLCGVCGVADADWDDNAGELRCSDHHEGGREQDGLLP